MESLWVVLSYHLEVKETTTKKSKVVKQECIASTESMKEVERKLWLTHFDGLSKKLMEVIREKCTGCQTAHDLCLFASAEEQVNLCFKEVYGVRSIGGGCDELLVQECTQDVNSFKSRDVSYFQRNC